MEARLWDALSAAITTIDSLMRSHHYVSQGLILIAALVKLCFLRIPNDDTDCLGLSRC
jgi:hypothetical protein